jgi:hypothetical protein
MERGQSCNCTCSFSYIVAVDGSVSGTLHGYHIDILIGFVVHQLPESTTEGLISSNVR